jgi:xanthine dehydrogenase FAD-binding subunit
MYDIEALYEAESASHAVELLKEHNEARIIAGGSDVLIEIRNGGLAGCTLISIQKLDELRGVKLDGENAIRIGPMTSISGIVKDPIIQKHFSVLAEAAETIGGPQLRNVATIGGNVCNGVTSADTASTLMAYDAVMEYLGSNGKRLVPIGEHYTGPGKTALVHDEILTAIIIPKESYENCFGHYIKYAMREALDIATLGCSANVRLSRDKTLIERIRLTYGVAGPIPMRAPSAEKAAAGQAINYETINIAARAALGDIKPRTSWRASSEFRTHLAEELAKRALRKSIIRAGIEPGVLEPKAGAL